METLNEGGWDPYTLCQINKKMLLSSQTVSPNSLIQGAFFFSFLREPEKVSTINGSLIYHTQYLSLQEHYFLSRETASLNKNGIS